MEKMGPRKIRTFIFEQKVSVHVLLQSTAYAHFSSVLLSFKHYPLFLLCVTYSVRARDVWFPVKQ